MNRILPYLIISLILLGLLNDAFSQKDDFKLWLGAEASKEIFKNTELSGRIQNRFGNNLQSTEKIFGELGLGYKVTDFYSTGLKYRVSDFDYIAPISHRIDFDNSFEYERFNDKIDVRIRLQHRFLANSSLGKNRARIRFGFTHKFSKKFKVYAKAEYFYTSFYRYQNWDQQRYTAGTMLRVYKAHFVDLFYRFQNEFNVENPHREYILGIGYVLKL